MEVSKLQKVDREGHWQSGLVSVDADSRPMHAAQKTPLAAALIGWEIGDRIEQVVGGQAVGIGDAIAGTDRRMVTVAMRRQDRVQAAIDLALLSIQQIEQPH
jgi:hypothetical protein